MMLHLFVSFLLAKGANFILDSSKLHMYVVVTLSVSLENLGPGAQA